MSEQISGTHGPAEDDAIKQQDRRELQEHGTEWPDEDAPDEGEPSDAGNFALGGFSKFVISLAPSIVTEQDASHLNGWSHIRGPLQEDE